MPPGEVLPVVSADEQLASDDRPRRGRLEKGIALCLSGGGYRATLFHLGSLWYLNQAGWLPKLARVSSVSGGSITASLLALRWKRLDFDARGVAANFAAEVAAPLRKLASTTIDREAVLGGIVGGGSIGARLIRSYRRELFGDATLQDLPDAPRFVFNATNVQSGALFRFSKPYIWDWRVGRISNPATSLAEAVAASSAFPPVLSPIRLKFRPEQFDPGTGTDLQRPPFTREVVLSDGGVYDNLGIETAWKRYDTILVSDAGAKMPPEKEPKSDWLRHSVRVMSVIDNQVRSLRKRQVISSFATGARKGAYWGIGSNLAHYRVRETLPAPFERTAKLAAVPTRLEALPAATQERLVNWGFAITDAAMRKHVERDLPPPAGFPYPAAGI